MSNHKANVIYNENTKLYSQAGRQVAILIILIWLLGNKYFINMLAILV